MNINMLNPMFWFSLDAANVNGLLGKGMLGLFLFLFLVGIVCRIVLVQKTHDRYLKLIGKRLVSFCVTMGLLGLVFFFFSYEEIRLFGARIWYAFWFIGFVAWIAVIARFALKDIPSLREKNIKEHAKSKYIPGRKK
jgi:phosphatidylglycerophosphate synthase